MSDAHKNDTYGDDIRARTEDDPDVQPAIPAATVILLREHADDVQVLMLRKNSDIAFGGMWVFPGGRIDPEDHVGAADDEAAARAAAVREAEEEASIRVDPQDLVWFSHWTPPPAPRKRFATWFFAGSGAAHGDVAVDDGEITDFEWISPEGALARHKAGEIDLAPPTWVTLYQLSLERSVDALLQRLSAEVKVYSTRVAKSAEGQRVAMWRGDAGYEQWDADVPGARHRLVMARGGFMFENDAVSY